MNFNPVILAIPMYFILMGVELVYESITNRKTYRMSDAVTNISTGTLQQLTNTFVRIITVGIYVVIYEKFALFHLEQNWLTFIIAMLFWDLCYYWEHRMAHEISLFWGGHVVHHQSEDYNLSVALRQTSTGFIWGFPFFLPMAILGIDPLQFALVGGLNLLYQFWIHTEHIKKLPRWFEFIFNTPSHHRVHHGRDPKYIDKNYAGIFIFWDRLFGTFKEEEERPNYGVTTPLKSWNPVYANFAHYIYLYHKTKQAKTGSDRLKILFKKPGWLPDYLGGYQTPKPVEQTYQKYQIVTPIQINWYVMIQFFGLLAISSFYFFNNVDFDPLTKSLYALWIMVTTVLFGFLFEAKRQWVTVLEVGRLLVLPLGVYFLAGMHWSFYSALIFAVGSLAYFVFLMKKT